MLQTTLTHLSEPLPEIEVKTSAIRRDEVMQLMKGEEVTSALQTLFNPTSLQVILNGLIDTVVDRVIARLGAPPELPKTAMLEAPAIVDVTPISGRKRKPLSEEARKRIADAQRARWAKQPRSLTPEAKAKISDAQTKRWAAKKGTTAPESDTPTEADSQSQHNDPVIEAIPSEATLAVQEGYTGDPFYISADGHFIGMDGFVVPKDFDEFVECFPKFIDHWVRRRLNGQGIEEDIEDWCQDLMIHMKYLPPASKHRKAGKTDVFQTFDPFAQYGATERRWRSYINFCLANKYNTIHGKRTKNPVCRAGNLSLTSETNPEVHGEVTDEYVYSKSEYLTAATTREEKKMDDMHFVRAFTKYVMEHDPKVFPILMAVYEAGSSADTIKEYCHTCERLATTVELEEKEHEGHQIGMTAKEYNKARNRLKQLVTLFQKQRRRKFVKSQ